MRRDQECGFTLVETLVAVFIFAVLAGAALNLLLSSISAQRHSLATQQLVDQISFVAEYMSRALRQAQKETGPPLCLSAAGLNYEVASASTSITFIDRQDRCREIFLDSGAIKERIDTGAPVELTSDDLQVTALQFFIAGEGETDNIQPRAVFFMEIRRQGSRPEEQPRIRLQSMVSQREYDVIIP